MTILANGSGCDVTLEWGWDSEYQGGGPRGGVTLEWCQCSGCQGKAAVFLHELYRGVRAAHVVAEGTRFEVKAT